MADFMMLRGINNLTGREILGIYCSESRISYYCVKKGFSRVTAVSPGQGLSFSGNAVQSGVAGLREILRKIEFDPKRKIFLALPRSMFFAREVILPPIPVEDAIESVKNSISIYSHLPPDGIYYDIVVTPSFNDKVSCLFLYSERKKINRYRDVFRETGHFSSLVSVFPVSYGVCAWMYSNKMRCLAGVLLDYGDDCEFSVFDRRYWLASVTWDLKDKKNGLIIFKTIVSRFPEISDNLYRVDTDLESVGFESDGSEFDVLERCVSEETYISDSDVSETDDIEEKIKDTIRSGHNINDGLSGNTGGSNGLAKAETIVALCGNPAVAAVAPALCKIQQISIDEKPVRVNFVKPVRYIFAAACIIAVLLFFITSNLAKNTKKDQRKMNRLKQAVEQLQRKIEPVQNRVAILQKAASVKEDAELFLRDRPKLYTCINEIARLVPDGTWFSGFYFYNGVIHLNGFSKDALTTVKNLRKSGLFSKVRIQGPVVNRGANRKEQFSMVLTLNTKVDKSGVKKP